VFLLDGFRLAGITVSDAASHIHRIRAEAGLLGDELEPIYSDPDVFRRKTGNSKTVGETVDRMFNEYGITLRRANNDIISGIGKNWTYLSLDPRHEHPITGMILAPHFYVSDRCSWFVDEITEYYFKRDTSDEVTDVPVDRNDHAMDMWKYAMSNRPKLARFVGRKDDPPAWMAWHEIENERRVGKKARHK